MKFYNKILGRLFLAGILVNGCASMALVDEYHQIRASHEILEGAVPRGALTEMPMPTHHRVGANYIPTPQRKPQPPVKL